MIVEDRGEGLALVTQEDHAHLTGELAALLDIPSDHPAALITAARIHDNGWRETDAAPTVDHEGRPHTFSTVPDKTYEALWRRGIERAAAADPMAGLLVSLHGARFFGDRPGPGIHHLLAAERQRQARLLDGLGLGGTPDALPTPIARASDWIALLDALSLLLCGAPLPDHLTASVQDERYILHRASGTVTLTPWPFGQNVVRRPVPVRTISAGPYTSDRDLQAAFAAAAPRPVLTEARKMN